MPFYGPFSNLDKRVRSALQEFWSVPSAGHRGWKRLLSVLLTPPAWIYNGLTRCRRVLYRRGFLARKHLPYPVISVGGLRVGGSGKTPFALWMADRLQARGYRVAILTRGYGRKKKTGTQILTRSNLGQWNPRDCGDEPFLLAASLPDVPVAVNADRYQAGRFVLSRFPVDVFLLDDGFQHLRLARDLDVVLVPEEDSFRTDCLPKGPLRESFAALKEAGLLVRMDAPCRGLSSGPGPETTGKHVNAGLPVFSARFEPDGFFTVHGRNRVDPGRLEGGRALAFCGIARPLSFWRTLDKTGLNVHRRIEFPDHHPYSERDRQDILGSLNDMDWVITTEKDAGKVARFQWPRENVLFLRLKCIVENEKGFWDVVEGSGLLKGKGLS